MRCFEVEGDFSGVYLRKVPRSLFDGKEPLKSCADAIDVPLARFLFSIIY